MEKNLLSKFMSFSVGSFLSLFVGIISTPIITRTISPEQYGKGSMFILISSLMSVIILMGCEQSFVRFFYEEKEENRPKLLIESMKLPILMFITMLVISIMFKSSFSNMIYNNNDGGFFILTTIQGGLLALNNFALLTIRMQQKGKVYSLLTVTLKLSYIVLIVISLGIFNNDFRTVIFATMISNLVVTIIAIFCERKYWFSNKKNIILVNDFKSIVKFGWPLVFTFMVNWVFQSIDRILIKIFYDYSEVGIYAQAATLVGTIAVVQTAFTTFWTPVAYETYQKNPKETEFFKIVFECVTYVMFSIAIGIIMFKDIFLILLGNQYSRAIYIMPFLMFMPIMYTISEVSQVGINFKKKPKIHLLIAIISCLCNLILALILVPSLGSIGAAISTGISYIVFFSLRTYFSQKYYNINFNFFKFLIMLFILICYSIVGTFYKFSIVYLILGIVALSLLTLLNLKYIKDIYLICKKKINRVNIEKRSSEI